MTYGKKQYTPEFKMADAGPGEISGYASTYNWDSVKERVVPGAFVNLDEFKRAGFVAVGHDWESLPVASPVEAFEDSNGLFVRAMFHSTPFAQAARTTVKERLERGNEVGLSIGYEVLDDQMTAEGRLLKQLRLFEYSIVTVPAQPKAGATAAKSVLPAGLPMAEFSDTVLTAVKEFETRVAEIRDLRAKQGRVLSEANRKRIGSLLDALTAVSDDLRGLLAETEPKADPQKARALYAEFQRLEARLNGVPL